MLHIYLLRQYLGAAYVPEGIQPLLPEWQELLEMAPSLLFRLHKKPG
jgi:hypothetical protein